MSFSMHTFSVAFIICNIIQITVFGAQFVTSRTYRGMGYWLSGFISVTAGLLFMLFNGIYYSELFAVLNNAFFITGIYLIHAGIKRFFGKKENIKFFTPFFIIYMIAITHYSDAASTGSRIIIFSLSWSAVSLLICHTLVTAGERFTRRSSILLSILFFILSLCLIARAVITAVEEPPLSFLTPSALNIAVIIVLFIAANSLAFSLIIMVSQRLNGEIKEARDEAQENREKAENAGHEKEILLREVHHRIKNNMNTIIALLSIQAETVKEISARSALNDAEGRVRSMMILYDKLYRSETFTEISAREYLSPLSDEIVSGFPNGKTVTIRKEIDDFMMRSQTLFLMGIMINELLTNSMKYAFSETDTGTIDITVRSMNGHVLIITQDNGKGFPEDFDIKKSSGFGLQLVSMLTEQLKGTLTTDAPGGSKVTIEFNMQ